MTCACLCGVVHENVSGWLCDWSQALSFADQFSGEKDTSEEAVIYFEMARVYKARYDSCLGFFLSQLLDLFFVAIR